MHVMVALMIYHLWTMNVHIFGSRFKKFLKYFDQYESGESNGLKLVQPNIQTLSLDVQ